RSVRSRRRRAPAERAAGAAGQPASGACDAAGRRAGGVRTRGSRRAVVRRNRGCLLGYRCCRALANLSRQDAAAGRPRRAHRWKATCMRTPMDAHLETFSALLDGAPIEITALEAALADADARRGLVDFVRLRQLARDDGEMPRPDFAGKTERAIARRQRFARLRVPLPLAAAAVVLALLGGSLIDVKWLWPGREQTASEQAPPP